MTLRNRIKRLVFAYQLKQRKQRHHELWTELMKAGNSIR